VLILNTLKVPCFHTLLQVLILKGLAGGLFVPPLIDERGRATGAGPANSSGVQIAHLGKLGATKTKSG
jgi:hypothetical protein